MIKSIPATACPLCEPQHFDASLEQVPAPVLCKEHKNHPLGTLIAAGERERRCNLANLSRALKRIR